MQSNWPATQHDVQGHPSDAMCQLSVVVADITNTDPTLLKNDPADSAQLVVLQARVKELEMEQSLMQHELDNMSEVAQRADKQLRYMQGHTALTLHLAGDTAVSQLQDSLQALVQ